MWAGHSSCWYETTSQVNGISSNRWGNSSIKKFTHFSPFKVPSMKNGPTIWSPRIPHYTFIFRGRWYTTYRSIPSFITFSFFNFLCSKSHEGHCVIDHWKGLHPYYHYDKKISSSIKKKIDDFEKSIKFEKNFLYGTVFAPWQQTILVYNISFYNIIKNKRDIQGGQISWDILYIYCCAAAFLRFFTLVLAGL